MVKPVNHENKSKSCGQLQESNEPPIEPTPLGKVINEVVMGEDRLTTYVEKLTYVYAKDGRAQIPRSNTYVQTDKDRILLVGTDDQVFKDFVEGPLLRLFSAITTCEKKPCRRIQGKRRTDALGEDAFELDRLAQRVIACCDQYHVNWASAYIHHVFDPSVTVMLRAMRNHAEVISRGDSHGQEATHDSILAKSIARLVRFVRRASRSWRFINALKTHERQAQDNFESARNLIYHYAEERSKLLVLRLDLYYKPYFDVQRADEAIHNFLRGLRSKACKRNLLPGYLGFLIKRENGLVRGMHWHVMIICKGSEQRSADYLTRQLGEQWAKRTGQGPGSYHNCYANRKQYQFNGLGVLELDDLEKMAGLRAAIWYMSKQDCVIKATNSKVKNFWRSPTSKKGRKKLGRPRANADSLKLLRRMLGGARSKYPPGFSPPNRFGRT